MRSITSLQHPLIKHMVKLRQNRRYRTSQKRVIVSGRRLIEEVAQRVEVYTVLADRSVETPQTICMDRVYQVPMNVVKKVSGLEQPDGLVAEVGIPPQSTLQGSEKVVVIDRVRDPGNLGTLIRTGLALGWDGLFLLDESVDPFNEKVMRAARAGSLFLPYRSGNYDALQQLIQEGGFTLVVADARGEPFEEHSIEGPIALLLGNEGEGVSFEAREGAAVTVSIPMPGLMESLNVAVAGTLLLYHFGKKSG